MTSSASGRSSRAVGASAAAVVVAWLCAGCGRTAGTGDGGTQEFVPDASALFDHTGGHSGVGGSGGGAGAGGRGGSLSAAGGEASGGRVGVRDPSTDTTDRDAASDSGDASHPAPLLPPPGASLDAGSGFSFYAPIEQSETVDLSDIAAGDDGTVWFTANTRVGPAFIGHLTPDGTETRFPVSATDGGPSFLSNIVRGPNGTFWFVTPEAVGRITASGAITTFRTLASVAGLAAAGSYVWSYMPYADALLRYTSTGEMTRFSVPSYPLSDMPAPIAARSDGVVWFADFLPADGAFVRVLRRLNADGTLDVLPIPATGVGDLTVDTAGDLWLSDNEGVASVAADGAIRRIADAGVASEMDSDPSGVWFAGAHHDLVHVDRLTHALDDYPISVADCVSCGSGGPVRLSVGGDGAVWFVQDGSGDPFRVVGRVTRLVGRFVPPSR